MQRSRLFTKAMLFMVLAFGLIATSMSVVFALLLDSRLTGEYRSKALALTRSMAESDLDTILRRDAAAIQARIDQYLSIPGVAYVVVADDQGEIMAHTFAPVVPGSVAEAIRSAGLAPPADGGPIQAIVRNEDKDYLHVAQHMLDGLAGSVHVGMDRSMIVTAITRAILGQQAITLVIFALCSGLAYFFVRGLTRPLEHLAGYAKKVAAHDFSGAIDIRRNDEVGDLALAMTSMAGDVARLVQGLKASVESATADLEDALASLSAVVDTMAEGLLVIDADGMVIRHNPALLKLFRLGEGQFAGRSCTEMLDPDTAALAALGEEGMGQGARTTEIMARRFDGSLFPLEMSVAPVAIHGRQASLCILRDVTLRRQAEESMRLAQEELEHKVVERTRELTRANTQLKIEVAERRVVAEALRKTEARYRSIFENAMEGLFQIAPDGLYVSANPAMARILGYDSVDGLMREVPGGAGSKYLEPGRWEFLVNLVRDQGEVKGYESQVRRHSGRVIWVSETVRGVSDSRGELLYIEGALEDITLRKEHEGRLMHQAFHDPLTGLPNRALFLDHLRLAMGRAKRRKGSRFAVLYLDLDRFKVINDSLGHDAGDELLRCVARTLEGCARDTDTVARFGGDEFAVLLEDLEAPRDAIRIARRILEQLARPMTLNGGEVFTSASIGVVLGNGAYDRPEALLRDADTAMYRAKELGKSRFKIFNQKMHEQAIKLMELETELRKSVEAGGFSLEYQPILDMETRHVTGFEALLRWEHPRYGPVPPLEFIPVAEDTGIILPIDSMVVERVCATAARLAAEPWWRGNGFHPPGFHVNISAKQFRNPSLLPHLERVIRDSGITPGTLTLEITESALMDNPQAVQDILKRFQYLGVGVCIDDFGTGYSSLSFLQRFPIGIIKVDRSFVSGLEHDPDSRAVARSIVSLGLSLGLTVVAEGVETQEQLEFLRNAGCTLAQGFLFHRPMAEKELRDFLRVRMAPSDDKA